MLAQERYNEILSILKTKSPVSVAELTELTKTSESTIRRDLISLDKMGKLKKVRGGAMTIESVYQRIEDDVVTKANLCVEEKLKIAEYAATFILNDDFVYIDAGTTTEKLIDFIPNTNATFVTNGIVHAKKLIKKGLRAYVIGGQLKLATEAIIGSEGLNSMKKYNFTKAFLGTNGITLAEGFTTPDIDEAQIKAEAAKRSFVTYVLADHTKFGVVNSVTFADLRDACIITDKAPDDKYKDHTVIREVSK